MDETDIAEAMRAAFIVVAKLAGPMLGVALIAGIVVAVLQAVTQINEATLVFIPKVIAIGVVLALFGTAMFATLSDFTQLMVDRMVAAGGP